MAGEQQSDRLSLSLELQIDALCAELEERWSTRPHPQIEEFLERLPEEARSPALVELIAQEVELRRRDGTAVGPDEYRQRFPRQHAQVDAAFALLQRRQVLSPTDTKQDADPVAADSVGDDDFGLAGPASGPMPEQLGRYEVQSILGRGAFGVVYLGWDTELNRLVALKVPTRLRFRSEAERVRFLEEARTAAQLSHPGIVTVHDVFREEERIVIVQQYIEGRDLAGYLAEVGSPPARCAELIAAVAEAVAVAHQAGFVHRDLKPNNILIDQEGQPHVADFGVAIHESIQSGRRGESAGTPSYMSPEQVRGETHRLDGRSDLWSLGVILYEMLTGRRPFAGDSVEELFDEIKHRDPRPPRQIVPQLPAELERICLKCLAKRTADRYTTGTDLAGELREWLASRQRTTVSAQQLEPARVVPRGLRSFEARDADFFLQLVPGPRDRSGLPESIRFWKARVEELEPENTFAVGLVYGPSGCGKSSLVRAGLLPRLKPHVIPVCVEATASGTESRLLASVRKHCPRQDADLALSDLLASIRAGSALAAEHKMLIILDQFEQWLHANRSGPDSELVTALRHCDGARLQCLLVVRDDFWLSVSRFMRAIEIPLIEGRNVALVDLFDPLHARHVLAEFGRAFGRLPDRLGELTRDQQQFLDQAVEGLTQDEQVNCVRLALFADMIKGKPWNPATLRKVGGTEGLGVTFLEETFSARTAPAAHRHHQVAARSVLAALLPEAGTDIKGGKCSRQTLLEVSGYADRPEDFDALIRILDSTTRLITPTDPDDVDTNGASRPASAEHQYFQLTHDYLVPSLRQWLIRKQQETRRGRAELRLADRAELWSSRPETRHLPSFWEYLGIRALTARRYWTPAERNMMRRADRHYVTRVLFAALLLVVAGWSGWAGYAFVRAHGLVDSLKVAETQDVPAIVDRLRGVHRWADPRLREMLERSPLDSKEHLHASLALLPVDTSQVDYLKERLLAATPEQIFVLRDVLAPYQQRFRGELWSVLEDPADRAPEQVLAAAAALARYGPRDARWVDVRDHVVACLLHARPASISYWYATLRPIGDHLAPAMTDACHDQKLTPDKRLLAVELLTGTVDAPDFLAEAVQYADVRQFELLVRDLERFPADGVTVLRSQLPRDTRPRWNDMPLNPDWAAVDADTVNDIQRAHGMVRERFACCQTLPLEGFGRLSETLFAAGYRPSRIRPHDAQSKARVAAVWTRDGRPWQWEVGSADDIRQRNEKLAAEGYQPEDICGFVAPEDDVPSARFCGLWIKPSGPQAGRRLAVGLDDDEWAAARTRAHEDGFRRCARFSRVHFDSGGSLTSAIHVHALTLQGWHSWSGVDHSDDPHFGLCGTDLQVARRTSFQQGLEVYQADIERTTAVLKRSPEWLRIRLERAEALFHVGKLDAACDDLKWLADRGAENAEALKLKTLILARLGRDDEARSELSRFLQVSQDAAQRMYVEALVACFLGDVDGALHRLDAEMPSFADDPDYCYHAAKVHARAASLAETGQPKLAAEYRERGIRLLRQACDCGFTGFVGLLQDVDLEALRDHKDFPALLSRGQLHARYNSMWESSTDFETVLNHSMTADQHLARCLELAGLGYRPRCLTGVVLESGLTTGSLWERPLVPRPQQEARAKQQARIAAALLRLGETDAVWPLLAHSPDPRVRSQLIHSLSPLGVDPQLLIDRLREETDDSVRSALLLALGEYDERQLPADQRERVAALLTDVLHTHRNAGLHASADWLLRHWGWKPRQQDPQPAEVAERAAPGDGPATRHGSWYTTSRGHTLVVIEASSFAMGSPFHEADRRIDERLHRRRINRCFALGWKPITRRQYQQFEQESDWDIARSLTNPELTYLPQSEDAPAVGMSWYGAAAYCNWLSEKEGIPRDQWCYLPNEAQTDAVPLREKHNYLSLSGYRLPTEAEWEFACRADSTSSRYYGDSDELLQKYAWYDDVSGNRSHPVGLLKPNDWGLFDMHGNACEWCQTRYREYRIRLDDDKELEPVGDASTCVSRSAHASHPASWMRSALRYGCPPGQRSAYVGFRIARTMKSAAETD